jgi:hypothetical protein
VKATPEVGEGQVVQRPDLAQRADHPRDGDQGDPQRGGVGKACRDAACLVPRPAAQPEQQRHEAAKPHPRCGHVNPLDEDVEDHGPAGSGVAQDDVGEHGSRSGNPNQRERWPGDASPSAVPGDHGKGNQQG